MGAPKGNQYAKGCKTSGAPKSFATKEELRAAFDEYFDWADNTPLFKVDICKSGLQTGQLLNIPVQRPYLIESMCNYLGISLQTFANYESKEQYQEFFEVCAYARSRIYSQNIEYGYIGGFDAGLVARKLGIADKKDMEMKWDNQSINISLDGKNLRANLKVKPPESNE